MAVAPSVFWRVATRRQSLKSKNRPVILMQARSLSFLLFLGSVQ